MEVHDTVQFTVGEKGTERAKKEMVAFGKDYSIKRNITCWPEVQFATIAVKSSFNTISSKNIFATATNLGYTGFFFYR